MYTETRQANFEDETNEMLREIAYELAKRNRQRMARRYEQLHRRAMKLARREMRENLRDWGNHYGEIPQESRNLSMM